MITPPLGYWSHWYRTRFDDGSMEYQAWIYPRRPAGYPIVPDPRTGYGHGVSSVSMSKTEERS